MPSQKMITTYKAKSAEEWLNAKDGDSLYLKRVFQEANRREVSDLHFQTNGSTLSIRFRINGTLRGYEAKEIVQMNSIINRLKLMAGMDLSTITKTQSRSFFLPGFNKKYRAELIPTAGGESIVLRQIDQTTLPNLKELGLPESLHQTLTQALNRHQGLILLTGPTGSGKSTTLQAAISELDSKKNHILAIEDPVERTLPGITQIPITESLDWSDAIRSGLRFDPDIILIGEIRDHASAKLAIQAAKTGHLVLSTLHTNDTDGIMRRLENDFGIPSELLSEVLTLGIAQRLIKKLCPFCKIQMDGSFLPGAGCPHCQQDPGFDGRIPIFEYQRFQKRARTLPPTTLHQELTRLQRRGEISCDEVAKWRPHE